jgi:hypothetical protein
VGVIGKKPNGYYVEVVLTSQVETEKRRIVTLTLVIIERISNNLVLITVLRFDKELVSAVLVDEEPWKR